MNRSVELNIIDYSVIKTIDKGGDYNSDFNINRAFNDYYFKNNPNGFTRDSDARNYISSLKREDIEKEMLKNLFKKEACAKLKQFTMLLDTEKTFKDKLTISEAELIVKKLIKNLNMSEVKELLNKFPSVELLLLKSFVQSRYFDPSYGVNNLDNINILDSNEEALIQKIENYYLELAK